MWRSSLLSSLLRRKPPSCFINPLQGRRSQIVLQTKQGAYFISTSSVASFSSSSFKTGISRSRGAYITSLIRRRDDWGQKGSGNGLTIGLAVLLALASTNQDESHQEAPRFLETGETRTRTPILFSIASYPGNEHMEDRYEAREIAGGDFVCGIFDGHGGYHVAEYASINMGKNIEMELTNMGKGQEHDRDPRQVDLALERAFLRTVCGTVFTRHILHRPSICSINLLYDISITLPNQQQVELALERAFLRTDRGILYKTHHAFELGWGTVAKVGACAITLLVRDGRAYVANAGDSRAVLGLKKERRGYEAVALSEDHNAKLPKEMAALAKAHPGEKDIVKCKHPNACYVKGRLQPTRALGDAYLKYSEFNGKPDSIKDSTAGRYIPPPYTPPYISSTPEVKLYELSDQRAEFIVLATDGLWDVLSNEQVVDFIGREYASGDHLHVGQRLIDYCLEMRAKDLEMSVADLKAIPPGRGRRSKHDDITIAVIWLHAPEREAQEQSQHGAVHTPVHQLPKPPAHH